VIHFADINWLWTNPGAYNFFSSIWGELAFKVPILIWAMRHFNCNVTGCYRPGHKVVGTSHRACRKHHPGLKSKGERTTVQHIEEAHEAANENGSNL
jgi:hypothetical protein